MEAAAWISAITGIISAIAGVAAVVATFLIYLWTRTVRPRWELRQVVAPGLIRGIERGSHQPIELWIENVGERTAVGTYAIAQYPFVTQAVVEPSTGRRSIPPGGRLKLRLTAVSIQRPDGLSGNRQYIEGDDVYFDLSTVKVVLHWGANGRKKQRFDDLHSDQTHVPVIDQMTASEVEAG